VAQTALSWIPKCGEVIETSARLDLLERIRDGRQKHILEDSESTENAYLIDFENRLMEVEGVIDGTLEISFDDLKVGIIDQKRSNTRGISREGRRAKRLK